MWDLFVTKDKVVQVDRSLPPVQTVCWASDFQGSFVASSMVVNKPYGGNVCPSFPFSLLFTFLRDYWLFLEDLGNGVKFSMITVKESSIKRQPFSVQL